MNQENYDIDIPTWHMDLVRERITDYKNNPAQALDFEKAMDDIEEGLE
jgi:hypothetical protein